VAGDARAEDLAGLGRAILEAAYLEGDFVLSSGRRSRYYLDKYLFETRPDLLAPIAAAIARRLPAGIDRLAGPELGAVALTAAVSLAANLPFVIIRRAAKAYSTGRSIEGLLEPGEVVVVVEDVVTSGAQSIAAADGVRAAGGTVRGIVAVIDREEGGREAIEAAGLSFTPLFTRTSLGI
jgi:orotate phosphoribosyltransferase